MEGVLWKWTNYWSGWQTRWFVLDNGVLAYYKSQEEVSQGCKGSLKVIACQINVNSLDSTRLDLIIPGEQQICLRAPSPQERQLWLVALGSAKACMQVKGRGESRSAPKPETLKSKRSELRIYCDLLMQQVHSVKTAASAEDGPHIDQMDEATGLLSATCDTFIKTLEECMKLASAQSDSMYDPQGLASVPALPQSSTTHNKKISKTMNRSISEGSRETTT